MYQYIDKWVFPNSLDKPIITACRNVYTFLVHNTTQRGSHPFASSMTIDGVEGITYGHGIIDDDVAAHPFFGTQRIVDALVASRGWGRGEVVIDQSIRDPADNLPMAFVEQFDE